MKHKIYHSLHHEVIMTELGKTEHIADTWDNEIAALIARLLNEEVSRQREGLETSYKGG